MTVIRYPHTPCKYSKSLVYLVADGALADRLRGALQKLKDGFDSRTCLQGFIKNNHLYLGGYF